MILSASRRKKNNPWCTAPLSLSLSLFLSFQAEAEENSQGDTSVEEADNWSKAGERFAPLNPGSLKGPRVHRVVSKVFHVRLPRSYRFVAHTSDRYNRTITTIHALTVFNPQAILSVTPP